MAQYDVNGIQIEIESRGRESDPAFLLIRGLSTQLIQWPDLFLDRMVSAGFRTIVFDNRDAGMSSKFDAAGTPSLPDLLSGKISPAYTVADMAEDSVGVLDALGVEKAHVAGMSLGGMIAQHLAFTFPGRFHSVTSVMSSSGAPGLPGGTPEAMAALISSPDDPNDREGVIAHQMRTQKVISSPGFAPTPAELRSYCARAYDRCYCPAGSARQMAAVLTDGTRAERLAHISIPFQVLHGSADILIPVACGEDTAKRVKVARLQIIEGMGHDITIANTPVITDALISFGKSA